MGSKKKQSLKQMEKMQARQSKKQPRKETGIGRSSISGSSVEKKGAGVTHPNPRSEKTLSEIKKMKVLTPYAVASRFNLRLSLARALLKELEQKGVIQYVSGSKNIKIYRPLD